MGCECGEGAAVYFGAMKPARGVLLKRLRVFVCYASDDFDLAERLVQRLRRIGLGTVWAKDVGAGAEFSDAIRSFIRHAHLVVPLITENSLKSPWVNQEIGYAMALAIPLVPVSVGRLPEGMIKPLHAAVVDFGLEGLSESFSPARMEEIVSPLPFESRYVAEVSDGSDPRTELLAEYADGMVSPGGYGRVRQRATLSSFWIPDLPEHDPLWNRCYPNPPPDVKHFRLLRRERGALERHVKREGCSLIIYPAISPSTFGGPGPARERLSLLREFLASRVRDTRVRVVISDRALGGNLTIVGDWFLAESVTPRPRKGYRQTIFNSHALTVLNAVHQFDDEFENLCRIGISGVTRVVKEIERIIRRLPRKPRLPR
jgi:hypothetical protein